MPPDEFEAIVTAQLAALPAWVRDAVRDVAFLVEDHPAEGTGSAEGMLLGLYRGVPQTRRAGRPSGSLPDTIFLYRVAILAVCRRAADVPPRVRSVLLHEIGHALGLGEERLRELGVG